MTLHGGIHIEARRVCRELVFPEGFAPYIDLNVVAKHAREVGGHFEVLYGEKDSAVVTIFWTNVATVTPVPGDR